MQLEINLIFIDEYEKWGEYNDDALAIIESILSII